ncbi:hydroxymethylglutaryl-CoA reductase, degradative [Granulicatella sp. 20925_1_45]|jgi:hydroxymethylglutaryl-coA reductase, degradative|uniref:hydroxymethylglutaryl-CoA reductase, degradative n=1 Tax=Granulicatella sp. 20925_1_45 TaxID=3003685 RepID=UPI00352E8F61
MQNNPFYKFYQKPLEERKETLLNHPSLSNEAKERLKNDLSLPESVAGQMVENQIEIYGLPYGIVPEIIVNGKSYIVPMVTEEPSVIAAASYASKLINLAGGTTTIQEKREMIGEIAIVKSPLTLEAVKAKLEEQKESLFTIANNSHPSIVKRGGGIRDIWVEEKSTDKKRFYIFYVSVDTQEAMGANMLNTILESLVSPIEAMTAGESIMAILSNLAINSVVTAKCVLSPRILDTKTTKGEDVVDRIVLASEFSKADPYRATTHNKGIMNGIDSVVIATGNDWRAIEAGAHAFASLSGKYQPLTNWTKDETGNLVGTITLPLPVGTVGGSISIHPGAQFAHELLGHPSAVELAGIIASIGLAQNLAAVRALVTDGIQKGHMRLQAKSLGLAVGATEEELPHLMNLLSQAPHLNQETAKALLEELRK